jgi:hypothetical protein
MLNVLWIVSVLSVAFIIGFLEGDIYRNDESIKPLIEKCEASLPRDKTCTIIAVPSEK